MRSILLKDYLEQRMYFFIILAVAVVSLLVAAFFKQLDPGVALVMLFGMQGPFFIYMAAHHQISSELSNRTFPFLTSLPISRFRLWLAKLLFVSLYSAGLMFFYVLLAWICGNEVSELWKNFAASPGLVIGIPITIVAYGFFTTMLPQGFSTIAFLVLLPFGFAIGMNSITVRTMNFEIAAVLLPAMFLILSALIFLRDKAMNSPWRGFKGIAYLIIGVMALASCWMVLDSMAESHWSLAKDNYSCGLPFNDGKSVLWNVETAGCWWDTIDPKGDGGRLFLQDMTNGEIRQVGRRYSSVSSYNPTFNQGFAAIRSTQISAGFLRGDNLAIIDTNGVIVKTFPDDEYGRNFKLIDEQRFIYSVEIKTDKGTITEFYLYEKGKGEKVVFAAQDDFALSHYLVMPSKDRTKQAFVAIAGMSDREPGKLVLISVPDGKRTILPVESFALPVFVCNDFVVYDEGRWNKKTHERDHSLVKVRLDGNKESLSWIDPKFELAGLTSSDKFLALLPDQIASDSYGERWKGLAEIDLVDKSVKEIFTFPMACRATVKLTQKADKAILQIRSCNERGERPILSKMFALDLETGKNAEFTNYNNASFQEILRLTGNRFMLQAYGGEGSIVDVASMTVVPAFSEKAILERLAKGGVSK